MNPLPWISGRGAINSITNVHNMGISYSQYHADRKIHFTQSINHSIQEATEHTYIREKLFYSMPKVNII